jgi:hypothetical protein
MIVLTQFRAGSSRLFQSHVEFQLPADRVTAPLKTG